jgi:hypothetical protein
MSYITINDSEIEVGKALREDLFYKIKNNLDDHEARLALAVSGNKKVEIFNLDFRMGNNSSNTLTALLYHEALQDFTLVEGAIQIYDKGSIVTGLLSFDVKKNSTPNDVGMVSVFTTEPTLDFSTASDYARATGTFNPTNQAILKGEILRLDITNIPNTLSKFRVVLIGEV